MDSAYKCVLDVISQLIVIGYDIVKRRNHVDYKEIIENIDNQ
jgi:hypothetical protein